MIDIIIIFTLIIFARVGYKNGLVKSLLTFASSIVALIGSFIVAPTVTGFLKSTPIYDWINSTVGNKVAEITFSGGVQSQGEVISQNITWLPDVLTQQIKLDNNSAMYDMLGANNITEYVSLYISEMILGLVALVITWIVFKIVVQMAVTVISVTIEHLPIIGKLNSQGGLVVGVLKGVLMFSIIGLIIPFIASISGFEQIIPFVQDSIVGNFIYENNLIVEIFNTIIHA